MKIQGFKKFAYFALISTIIVLLGFISANKNNDFGKTMTNAQMADMFGGGFVCPDDDCDTTSGSCPGGDTCGGEGGGSEGQGCYTCKTGNGKKCGTYVNEWGWDCKNGTESCNSGQGACLYGVCESSADTPAVVGTCATRPKC